MDKLSTRSVKLDVDWKNTFEILTELQDLRILSVLLSAVVYLSEINFTAFIESNF